MRENRLNRQPSGRGRSSKRTPSAPAASTKKGPSATVGPEEAGRPVRRRPRVDFTARAIIAVVVLAVVMISFANALRVWYIQSGDLATAQFLLNPGASNRELLAQHLKKFKIAETP